MLNLSDPEVKKVYVGLKEIVKKERNKKIKDISIKILGFLLFLAIGIIGFIIISAGFCSLFNCGYSELSW